MPTSLSFEEHGEALGDAWSVLRDNAARAGLDAAVPSCPGWRVLDLVSHQGMVHRWATGLLRGHRVDERTDEILDEGLRAPDPLGWFDEGARDLLAALALAPDDPEARFFLPDAPAGKAAWARRQCHETTIHAVDAMAAALGRVPPAAQTWLRPGLAHDGVDELLCGFVARSRVRLRSDRPYAVVVRASDTGGVWTMRVSGDPVVTTVGDRHTEVGEEVDGVARVARVARVTRVTRVVEIAGSAAQLYLGLWNRGDELSVSDPDFLDEWRRDVTVGW